MSVFEKLMKIQTQIKAPKNLYNTFGKYHYRNAESICEAVKPYLESNKCALEIYDEIISIEGRFYVKATCRLTDYEDGTTTSVSAWAREPDDKKGMDASQITGATSSYARKYALNGMFLLDDTKDADSDEAKIEAENRSKGSRSRKETPEEAAKNEEMIKSVDSVYLPTNDRKITQAQWDKFHAELERTGVDKGIVLAAVSVKEESELDQAQIITLLNRLSATADKGKR